MSPRRLSSGCNIAWYEVRQVLGESAYGITYRAFDTKLECDVAIREYLPEFCVQRDDNNRVITLSKEHERIFNLGCDNFLLFARAMCRFNHDNIVKVTKRIRQFNTVYMVMEYESGDSLKSIVEQQIELRQHHQAQIFLPILDGLQKIHRLGFIHRNITPSNILIRDNGTPVLIGLGSARQFPLRHTLESTAKAPTGHMPLEQYNAEYGEQGPWTDIYSIAATMYQSVSGFQPDVALNRLSCKSAGQPDKVKALSTVVYPSYQPHFLSAMHSGLTLQSEFRPQSLIEWKAQLEGKFEADKQPAPATSEDPDENRTILINSGGSSAALGTVEQADRINQPRDFRDIGFISLLMISLIGIYIYSINGNPKQLSDSTDTDLTVLGSLDPNEANKGNTAEANLPITEVSVETHQDASSDTSSDTSSETGVDTMQDLNGDATAIVRTGEPVSSTEAVSGTLSREQCSNRLEVLSSTGEIYFDSSSATLDPASIPLLSAIIGITERCSQFNLEVSGHTDSTGNEAENQLLSELRAKSVAQYLTDNGVDPARITTVGYGEEKPIVVNNSALNRARNRRIEFTIAD